MSTKHYALYVRVSTDAQAEEGYSISAQTERLIAYCTAKHWQPYTLYQDGGFSGSHLDRPQMQQLIVNVRAEQVHAVLVFKLDRLSRSQKDTLYLIEDVFLPNAVDFVSLGENIDTSTPYGRAMIGILSAFAQLERENIFLRTRMGMLERVKKGYWMGGGTAPYGYDYDAQQGVLVPNADAVQVKRAYALYIQGYAPAKIAQLLALPNERTVTQLLSRRTNLGRIPYKGQEYQGRHAPIIDQQTYDLAMQKMQARAVTRAIPQASHLLSGLIYCGACGTRMRYIKWGKSGYKLRCYGQDRTKSYMKTTEVICDAPAVWADEIEQAVLADLSHLSAQLTNCAPQTITQTAFAQRIAQQERKLRRLYQLYADADDDALLQTIAATKQARDRLCEQQANQASQAQQQGKHDWVVGQLAQLGQAWQHLTAQEQQGIVRDCVHKIVITDERAEIFYTLDLFSPSTPHAHDYRGNSPLPARQ